MYIYVICKYIQKERAPHETEEEKAGQWEL